MTSKLVRKKQQLQRNTLVEEIVLAFHHMFSQHSVVL